MALTPSNIFFFGYGYVAQNLQTILPKETQISGCKREPSHLDFLYPFDNIPDEVLDQFDYFLISIPPDKDGDIVLARYGDYFAGRAHPVKWIGYLSATSVYGDHNGHWIDESTMPSPQTLRAHYRLLAEQQWQTLTLPLTILRLSGIYGPGRSALESVLSNKVALIRKHGHSFNRIHVDDICQAILALCANPIPLINLADDMPCPLETVYEYAYTALERPLPAIIPYEQAHMSPMMKEFFSENKRIKNHLLKKILNGCLLYPNYKNGLDDCLKWLKRTSKDLT